MPIGITMLQHKVYRQSGPVWVDDMDPVWIIIVAPSHTMIVPSGTYINFMYPLLGNMQA